MAADLYIFPGIDEQVLEEAEESNDIGGAPPCAAAQSYQKNNCLCIAEPDKVDEILGVQHYIAACPKIPIEELHASSVQHPHHPSMRWLLHSPRVPKHVVQSDSSPPSDEIKGLHEAERGVPPSMNIFQDAPEYARKRCRKLSAACHHP